MNIFLKLKHWQLFILIWGIPFLLNIINFTNPLLAIIVFPAMVLLFGFGTFGWIWSISTGLHPALPDSVKLNLRTFRILFLIPIVYVVINLLWLGMTFGGGLAELEGENPEVTAAIIFPLHLLCLVLIFWGMRFAAKTLKSVELGRLARFRDYAGEFFLIWFSFVGCWVLQPRLNTLADK